MPGVFGGLMRYDSEYKSKFMISPRQVIGFVIVVVIFILALKLLFPIAWQPYFIRTDSVFMNKDLTNQYIE